MCPAVFSHTPNNRRHFSPHRQRQPTTPSTHTLGRRSKIIVYTQTAHYLSKTLSLTKSTYTLHAP